MQLFPFQELDVYRASKALAKLVIEAQIGDAELRDHATRAAKSVFLNVAEGLPQRSKAIRRRRFETARDSLGETVAAVDLAEVEGAISEAHVAAVGALAVRLWPMLHGLLRPLR